MRHPDSCDFCITTDSQRPQGIEPERVVEVYKHWFLVLQREEKRAKSIWAAGMLISKQQVSSVGELGAYAMGEFSRIYVPASELLCEAVGTEIARDEQGRGQTRVGFNDGEMAGQTVPHAHIHLAPVSVTDPEHTKGRAGFTRMLELLAAQD